MPEHKNTEIKKGNKTVGAMQSLNYQGFSIIFIDTNKSDISIFKIKP